MDSGWDWIGLVLAGLRLSTPLIFAALGGLLSERSGIANIALEGFLLTGAFFSAAVTASLGSPVLGVVAAVLAGGLVAALFGWLSIYGRGDHIVMGMAVNMLVVGLIPGISKIWFGVSSSTPSLALESRLNVWSFLGVAIVLAFLVRFFLASSRFGLRLRASGENMEASRSLGISVKRIRFYAVVLSGAITAIGGAFLAIAHGSQYSRGMSAGRGFIALAALILAGWRPIPVLLACFVFGLADAAQILFQSFQLSDGRSLPVQWIQMFPYVVTLLVLVVFVGKTSAPRDIGRNAE